jgi:hypothetical protein
MLAVSLLFAGWVLLGAALWAHMMEKIGDRGHFAACCIALLLFLGSAMTSGKVWLAAVEAGIIAFVIWKKRQEKKEKEET